MSTATAPKVSIVRDNAGRNIVFLEASLGLEMLITQYGPRYQKYVVKGGPITIHHDVQLGMFRLSPMILKDGLNTPRYQHIADLPDCAYSSDEESSEESGSESDDEEIEVPVVDEGASSNSHTPPAVKIPRPPNSWILYRKEKSKELRQANPAMSAGEISTEASRQWKLEEQTMKDYYQALAEEEARRHKIKYPDYRYKPGRK
ncbi:Sporulation minus regulator 2 [Cytospora mali]|uniref:Sporulation minus regulator 2 n=1 Tax=Cytospora mali TaxID=578113 RepID=A0A194W8F3_CYTMA|nr:Sporulation minus regulator 2 [Valsa mali]